MLQNLIESKYIGEQEKWDASVEQEEKKQSWKGQSSTERKVKFWEQDVDGNIFKNLQNDTLIVELVAN